MAANEGKKFEKDIKESCENQGIWIIRLSDSSLSWQHERTSRFTVNNPCDFLAFQKPNLFAIECKSTKYKSMSFSTNPDEKSVMIKAHQINSLINFSLVDGIYAGFILNFRNDEDVSKGITYWWSIQDFSDFINNTDKQSINKLDVIQHNGIIIEQKLKRVRFTYNIEKLINDITMNGG